MSWADIKFGNYIPSLPPENFISVREEVGTRQYKFVWIDACQSSGVGPYAPEEMTTNINGGWRAAFNAGCMVGWNGNAAQMFSQAGVSNVWYRWSAKFWEYLANGSSVWDSYFTAYLDTDKPPYNASYFPWTSIDVSGNIYPKRVQFSDCYVP